MGRSKLIDKIALGIPSYNLDDASDFSSPLDVDEQEKLIQRFETRYASQHSNYLRLLSSIYLVLCGLYLLLAVRLTSYGKTIAILSMQSLLCSFLTLRYRITTTYYILGHMSMHLTNKRLSYLNMSFLVLILWMSVNQYWNLDLPMFLQSNIPLLLYIIAQYFSHITPDLQGSFQELRQLKYKYKNV